MSLPTFVILFAACIAQAAAFITILYVCDEREYDLGGAELVVIWLCAVPIILAAGVLAIKVVIYGK